MNTILVAVLVLGGIGLIAAAVLFVAAKKFAVEEDPRIGQVAELLPQANCGGCGFPGCSGMADACVKAANNGSLEGLSCPVGGNETMEKIAAVLGMEAVKSEPKVAVVRCNGTCENRPRTNEYDGLKTCKVQHMTAQGETACAYGCLGCGDCVAACQFGAIRMDEATGLPFVDEDVCGGCGACSKACPRGIIEIRKKGPKGRKVYVQCVNKDKGPVAMKACKVSCIGCGKCEKACNFDAVHVADNVAYIDPDKCKMCRKCEDACPKGVIVAPNFPVRKPKTEEAPVAETPASKPETTNENNN